jgi:hypothetical protein
MAHYYKLHNNVVAPIAIKSINPTTSKYQPLPNGDEFTIENSNPDALNAVIGTNHVGAPAVLLNALVPEAQGIMLKISDSAGLAPVELEVEIIPAPPTEALDLDVLNILTSPQPAPGQTEPAASQTVLPEGETPGLTPFEPVPSIPVPPPAEPAPAPLPNAVAASNTPPAAPPAAPLPPASAPA